MRRLSAILLLMVGGLCACTTHAPPANGYYGPTLSLQELVAKVNENNSKITSLWAREHFQGLIVDRAKDKATHIDGYGNLMFTSPNQMKLTAKNELTDFFEMGSDGKQFWFYDKHDAAFWWGDLFLAQNSDTSEIPIRPDLVMEILGVRPLDAALLSQPAPVLRFNNFGDAYMVDWVGPAGDHLEVVKEIWYDRATLLPEKIMLFDSQGRVVVWANLSNFVAMKMPEGDEKQWPMVASRYELSFPYTGTRIDFELSDVTLKHVSNSVSFPNPASYRMPSLDTLNSSGVRVEHIDAQNGH